MMCSSFYGMGRPAFAVQATAVNHGPGLQCNPCTRFVPSGREGGLEAPGDLKLEALGRGLLAGLVLAGAFYVQRQA